MKSVNGGDEVMDGYSAFLVLEDFVSMLEDEGREPRRGLREYMRRIGGHQNLESYAACLTRAQTKVTRLADVPD